MKKSTLLILALLATGCVFEGEDSGTTRPRTTYDFTRLDSLPNPLARWYPLAGNRSVVGVKFAFRSMEYEKEVDSNLAAFALEAGSKPAIAGAYFDLSSQPKNMKRFLDAVGAQGVIPFVTLDPKDWDEPDIAYQRSFIRLINEGKFDSSLEAQAAALRDFGKPVMIRFGHEMNGNWYPYSGVFIGGKTEGPTNYVKAWRRVHGIFTAAGADKLLWVYCPNWESFPAEEWNRPYQYYPGSEFVDLISVDTYESPDKRLVHLSDLLDEVYNDLGLFLESRQSDRAFVPKPFGLSEFGTPRKDAAAKGDWYAAALQTIAVDSRMQFNILYNARNGSQDFSITGLGERLKAVYASARFQFSFTPILAGSVSAP